jgi:hypothetical protein
MVDEIFSPSLSILKRFLGAYDILFSEIDFRGNRWLRGMSGF